jgi:hypothetical protein
MIKWSGTMREAEGAQLFSCETIRPVKGAQGVYCNKRDVGVWHMCSLIGRKIIYRRGKLRR